MDAFSLGRSANTIKLRSLLDVPPTSNVTFERFSDSAGSYIALDSNNPAVYKQLYRAAKAKLKLRLKATITDVVSLEADSTTIPNRLPAHCYDPSKDASTPSLAPVPTEQQLLRDLAPSTASLITGGKPFLYAPPDQSSQKPNPRSKLPYDPCLSPSVTAPAAPSCLLDTANPVINEASSKQPVSLNDFQMQLMLLEQQNKKRLLLARQPTSRHDYVLQDYQMQLMLLEQQNKKRLLMARQEQNMVAEAPVPRSFVAGDTAVTELPNSAVNGIKKPIANTKNSAVAGSFTICCNKCQANIPSAHWHCSTCNAGDFDLCATCIEKGVLCDSEDHWLIKRIVKDGKVVNSTTETIPPKTTEVQPKQETAAVSTLQNHVSEELSSNRTCNSCVEGKAAARSNLPLSTDDLLVFPESEFVTCKSCEDFDLCISCFEGTRHGHHPGHAFAPACSSTKLDSETTMLCSPGRNTRHFAICDGCDKVSLPKPFP